MRDDAVPYTIIVPTIYGTMLANRYDINQTNALVTTGRGADHEEIAIISRLFDIIPVSGLKVFVDIGANIGTHTVGLSEHLGDSGVIYSFEPQRILFQMICGSLAINSYTNVHCHNVALGSRTEWIDVPHFDYFKPMNFGSIEFGSEQQEPLHQRQGMGRGSPEKVMQTTLDSYSINRVHVLKIDVEGMETEVLKGAEETIRNCKPIILIEYLKSDKGAVAKFIRELSYTVYEAHPNFLCIPHSLSDVVKVDSAEFKS